MITYYKSGFHTGVIKFSEYLKQNSCSYDLDNYHSFNAIDIEDLDDLIREFFKLEDYI